MKKGMIIGLGILGVVILGVIIIASSLIGSYNNFVTLDENVNKAFGDVQGQYQRRADLIPNLVSTVKGAADFEKSVLTQVTEARAKVGQYNVTPELINDPNKFKQFQAAQGELSGALSRLLVTVESYPQLKSNENFLQLQAQLEGTENRISVERRKFNEAVQIYNTEVKRFPGSMIAGMFGYMPKPYFEAEQGAEKAPKVAF